MTDKQIKKAWEICVSEEIRCSECPVDEVCGNFEIKDLLGFINRQKVEIEKLNTVNADMHESLRLACETNKGLQAEIETLDEENTNLVKMLDEKCDECIEFNNRRAKAEAIKKCFEEIEQADISESDDYIIIKKKRFDNLVKEMVGDVDEGEIET